MLPSFVEKTVASVLADLRYFCESDLESTKWQRQIDLFETIQNKYNAVTVKDVLGLLAIGRVDTNLVNSWLPYPGNTFGELDAIAAGYPNHAAEISDYQLMYGTKLSSTQLGVLQPEK